MFVGTDRKITMWRSELLTKLRENLAKHQTAYEEAVAERKAAILVYAAETLKQVKAGDFSRFNGLRGFNISEPVDHSKEYTRAIAMVDASIEDEIVIDENTFAKWVMDEWGYTNALNEIYLAASAMSGKLKK